MPAPIKVELVAHSPEWGQLARTETLRLIEALRDNVSVVHHIGSTAVPGIRAKPIIDLMPILRSMAELDRRERVFAGLGYRYWGEYGIPGRRYCTLDDPATGTRIGELSVRFRWSEDELDGGDKRTEGRPSPRPGSRRGGEGDLGRIEVSDPASTGWSDRTTATGTGT